MKYFKTLLALLALTAVLALLSGCQNVSGVFVVTGSGKVETRSYPYADFARVEAGSFFQVSVSRSDTFSVSVIADDNLFDYVEVREIGNTLYVQLRGTHKYLSTTQKAVITMPDVLRFAVTGASTGSITGFQLSHPVAFAASGASSLNQDNLTLGDASFEITGASKITGAVKMQKADIRVLDVSRIQLSGEATDLNIEGSGAAGIELAQLSSNNVHINLGGVSSAVVNPAGKLDGELSGVSKLRYLGTPILGDIKISGGSRLSNQ